MDQKAATSVRVFVELMRIAPSSKQGLDLARVLVVHGELAPRLTLQTILRAGGYSVDVAGSSSEACKLDSNR